MATSEVSICNLAIARVGGESISTLSENTKAAKLCNIIYSEARDTVLSEIWWTFATKRQTLARLSATPNSEFDYKYQLPSDLLLPQYVYSSVAVEYRIEEGTLVTNEEEVKLIYTSKITDPAQFPSTFKECLSFKIAAELAIPLTNNPTYQSNFTKLYEATLSKARVTDQRKSNRKYPATSGWLTSRLGNNGRTDLPKKLSNE